MIDAATNAEVIVSNAAQLAGLRPVLSLRDVSKSFVMHLRGGIVLPVVAGVSFDVAPGECVVLGGPSGAGKSSILKMIYGNYSADAGEILVARDGDTADIVAAAPRDMLAIRRDRVGYVSQFLRTIPRVSTLDVVAEPLTARGIARNEAQQRAARLLSRLNLAERLWSLPPATFSGGEQQRVNIARGFITDHPVLLLDEPTASLDAVNRQIVVEMIEEKKQSGVAMVGIFHDDDVRHAVASRIIDVTLFSVRGTA